VLTHVFAHVWRGLRWLTFKFKFVYYDIDPKLAHNSHLVNVHWRTERLSCAIDRLGYVYIQRSESMSSLVKKCSNRSAQAQASSAWFLIGLTPMKAFALSISLSSRNSILFFIVLSFFNHSQCHTLVRYSMPTLFCLIWSVFGVFILTSPFHELN
jgi:hypothetical protein